MMRHALTTIKLHFSLRKNFAKPLRNLFVRRIGKILCGFGGYFVWCRLGNKFGQITERFGQFDNAVKLS